ncbi:MAG: methyltransferase domain-containing protein [Candidatus Omnitrophica bacterium]|nr:methyltransferase domain-containing protein [Candidatus Omnitrophota bacterium]
MKKNRDLPIVISAFVLGLTSLIGQILLLRELVTVFYGNEMAYAVILASWLFWIAVGSYVAGSLSPFIKSSVQAIGILQAAVYLILPATIVLSRHINEFMRLQTGEIIGIIPMSVLSFVLLAPLAMLLGGSYTMACLFFDEQEKGEAKTYGIGTVYFWESTGAAVGGLAFSFILVRLFPALHIAFFMGAVNLAVAMAFPKRPGWLFVSKMILVLATVIMLLSGLIGKIDQWTRKRQWRGLDLVAVTDSIYGNIAIIKTGEEYSLYENGLFSFATRDDLSSEESVHFPLLEHPGPRQVLLVGNGIGGSLREILKHPLTRVDYVELDPKIIDMSKEYLPDKYTKLLEDGRVRVFHADARWLVKQTPEEYDVVIINLSDPYTALINRYYTQEFFQEARRILKSGGILALSVSSSENYINEETRAFLRSIHTTLKSIFADVKSVPGNTNIFMACGQSGVLTYDHQVLTDRLKARGVQTKYVREYYLPDKLSPDRLQYIENVLSEEGALNTDIRPIAYLYDIVLWSTHFNTGFKALVAKVQYLKFRYLFLVALLVFLGGWAFRKVSGTAPVSLSIVTTGFSEIVFQLVVILAFQTLYGYAYYKIGLIIASFMAGLCLGALTARHFISKKPDAILRAYKIAQLAIVLYPAVLPLVFVVFRDISVTQKMVGVFATVFATLPAIAGFIGGFQYPLAAHILHSFHSKKERSATKSAGFLYAVDVLGATVGALLTGIFFIPLYGIFAVAFLCMAINGAVFLLLYPAKLSPDL